MHSPRGTQAHAHLQRQPGLHHACGTMPSQSPCSVPTASAGVRPSGLSEHRLPPRGSEAKAAASAQASWCQPAPIKACSATPLRGRWATADPLSVPFPSYNAAAGPPRLVRVHGGPRVMPRIRPVREKVGLGDARPASPPLSC